MLDDKSKITTNALQDFRMARLQANLERIQAALTGKSADLLSYEDVREKVRARETNQRVRKDIPLDAIVGSVGRSADFTRRFFPRQETNIQRWSRVRTRVESMEGLPPIEVYQVGEVYFVIDGNHRVSVARSLDAKSIEAFVTQVETSVPLTADVDRDQLIIAERYAKFAQKTNLLEVFPKADFKMSEPGNYRVLEQQIAVHQEWMGEGTTYQEAAVDWYQNVYCPVIQIIRQWGMMRNFPERTETDLYVWIEKHRQELIDNFGWSLEPETAAADLVEQYNQTPKKIIQRATQKLMDAVLPDALEAGPMPGEWRQKWLAKHLDEHLFRHILVAVNGQKEGWNALDLGLTFAQHEDGQIYGLHVIDEEADENSLHLKSIRRVFDRHCQKAGISAELRIESGKIARAICDNARWVDLVVVSLAHPPGPQALDRLSSGFSQLLRRCPRPVLSVPESATQVERLLLAYDGSPSSQEAMFIAAYLANEWGLPLTVVTVLEDADQSEAIHHARQYLEEKNVQASYFAKEGKVGQVIQDAAKEQDCDLIIMGSYGHGPVMEIALGSTVDEILRAFKGAVIVCR